MPSIEQNAPSDSLPDFRSPGVALRILLLAAAWTALVLGAGMVLPYRRQE